MDSSYTYDITPITNPSTRYNFSAYANSALAIRSDLTEFSYTTLAPALSYFSYQYTVKQDPGEITITVIDANGVQSAIFCNEKDGLVSVPFTGSSCTLKVDMVFTGQTNGPKCYILHNDTEVYSLPSQTYTASQLVENVQDGDTILIKNESTCFPAGTPVLMADGSQKLIETIEVGDKVQAFNIDTYEYVEGNVDEIVTGYTTRMAMVLTDSSGYIAMAEGHPLYTTQGWKSLTNQNDYPTLEIGDKLLTEKGYATIIDLQVVDCEPVLVYSLSISGGGSTLLEQQQQHLQRTARFTYFAGNGITVATTHSGGA